MADIQKTKFTTVDGDNLIILPDLSGAINGDVLTYDSGLNAVSWKPPQSGTEYTAGTDLVINNGIIGVNTTSTAIGNYAFAEGIGSSAIGEGSHAEGGEVHYGMLSGTIASGTASHSEGVSTSAIGDYSHAEGFRTIASGDSSHSEGNGTSALGRQSHAAGCETRAIDAEMFVCGRANATTSGAAFVVGNGYCATADMHVGSDAFIVDWNGVASATNLQTSAGYVITDVMLTSATNSSASFVTNGVADLTSLYTYIKSLEDRIAALEAAQSSDGFTVNGIQPTVNGNTITVGE